MSPGEEQYNGGGVSAARSARRACAKSASRRDVRKHSQQPAAPLRIPLSPLPSRWSPLGVPLKERMTRVPGGANTRSWGAGARSIALWVAESALRKRGGHFRPLMIYPNAEHWGTRQGPPQSDKWLV